MTELLSQGTIRALVAEARRTGDWSAFVGAVPYAKWLGLSIAIVDDTLVTTMRFDPMLVGNYTIPALHGGTLGGLLESTAIFTLMWAHEAVVLPKIVNVTVDYLRSARAIDTHATAILTKQGRRISSVRAFAWQEDREKPVATANAHFLVDDA